MSLIQTLFISVVAVMLLLPAAHFMFEVIPAEKLNGVTKVSDPLEMDFQSILKGRFQERFEKYLKRESGIWPYLVKTDNQLNFSVFRQVANHYRSQVVLGNDDNLIEKAYLKGRLKNGKKIIARVEKKLRKLKQLQDLLAERGIPLLLLISPSKPGLYPEFVPADYTVPAKYYTPDKYRIAAAFLQEHGINVVDGHDLLAEMDVAPAVPFFAASGTHWNEHASCLVSSKLIEKLEVLTGKDMVNISCWPVVTKPYPAYPDRDLVQLVNLWDPTATYKESIYPRSRRIEPEHAWRPDALFVGSSFLHSILRYFDRHRVYRKRDFYYYFKRNFTYPQPGSKPINTAKLDWKKKVFSKDFIVIEINEAFLERLGYTFLQEALQQLSGNKFDQQRVMKTPENRSLADG